MGLAADSACLDPGDKSERNRPPCRDGGQMLDFQLQNSRAHPRTLSVADPKQDEGFKVVDRRLFTDQGELRKDVAEQERRDEEATARKTASAPQAASQANARVPAGRVIAPGGGVLTSQSEAAQTSAG